MKDFMEFLCFDDTSFCAWLLAYMHEVHLTIHLNVTPAFHDLGSLISLEKDNFDLL